MPDWRKAEDYAYTSHLSPRDWAWEFLRRGAEYRAAWAEMSEVEAALSQDSNLELVKRRDALQAKCHSFGLELYRDPDRTALEVGVPWIGETGSTFIRQGQQVSHQTITWPGVPTKPTLTLTFDRSMDESEIETTMRAVGDLNFLPRRPRKGTLRYRPDDFGLYLRLLDAKRARESVREMGRVLFEGKVEDPWKSAQKALRQAESLARGRYRELLSMTGGR